MNTAVDAAPVPTAPLLLLVSGVTATQLVLTWTTASGATSFNVKRATTSGGVYSTVSKNIVGASYTDINLVRSTSYYYKVSASNANGESYDSMEAHTTIGSIDPERTILQLGIRKAPLNRQCPIAPPLQHKNL